MDLSNLFPKNTDKGNNQMIQPDSDPAKYEAIKTKFFEKRKTIDQTLKNKDLDDRTRESTALLLIQAKEDMRLFGIPEVEYIAYLEKEPASGSDQPLPFS